MTTIDQNTFTFHGVSYKAVPADPVLHCIHCDFAFTDAFTGGCFVSPDCHPDHRLDGRTIVWVLQAAEPSETPL